MKKLAIVLIAACFITACTPAQQAPQPIHTPAPTSQPASPPSDLDIQVQDVNGIRIEVSQFRLENGQFTADVCYEIPDSRDWMIWNIEMTAGIKKTQAFEMALIELRHPAVDGLQNVMTPSNDSIEPDENDGGGLRCDTMRSLEILPSDQPITLHIGALVATPYEGEVCAAAYLERVNALLAEHDPALRADCFIQEFEGGGGSSGLKIVAWPNSMNEDEAQAVMDRDFYLDLNGIRGPWVFVFPVQE